MDDMVEALAEALVSARTALRLKPGPEWEPELSWVREIEAWAEEADVWPCVLARRNELERGVLP